MMDIPAATVAHMAPWPRRLVNFPIILIAITCQLVWAGAILVDQSGLGATGAHILGMMMPRWAVVLSLTASATAAITAFYMHRRIATLLLLLPQQLMLYLSASAALLAIYNAEFADGTQRSHSFLLVDQIFVVLTAIFHTWAIILIALYAHDHK